MVGLNVIERNKLEELFGMEDGYVTNVFDSHNKMNIFLSFYNIDITQDKYTSHNGSGSKANKLRAFWDLNDNHIIGLITKDMITIVKDRTISLTTEKKEKLIQDAEKIASRLLSASPLSGSPSNLEFLKQEVKKGDLTYLKEDIKRIEKSIEDDPILAIGQSKELIETCCKTILFEYNVEIGKNPKFSNLIKKTLEELELVPEGIEKQAKGNVIVKSILGSLGAIANNIAELRNLYGTGHGKKGDTKGLSKRHARLAAGTAATLVTFLFETFEERHGKNPFETTKFN